MATLIVDAHATYQHLGRVFRNSVFPLRLSLTEAVVMRLIHRNPYVTAAAIRTSTGLCRSTLSSLLARLEQRGYLRRLPGFSDRRSRELVLTAGGRAVASDVVEVLGPLIRDLSAYARGGSFGHVSQLADALAIIDQPRMGPGID
jgi:DNA-binding MarR family transcriptional regulator